MYGLTQGEVADLRATAEILEEIGKPALAARIDAIADGYEWEKGQ